MNIEELKETYLHKKIKYQNKIFEVKHIFGRYLGHNYQIIFCGRDKHDVYVEIYFDNLLNENIEII